MDGKKVPVGRAAWRACRAHRAGVIGVAAAQLMLRFAMLAWPFVLPLLLKEEAGWPGWLRILPAAVICLFAVIPLRGWAGERFRFFSAPRLPLPKGGKPYPRWLGAGLLRYLLGLLWGLPFLLCVGYFVYGYKHLDMKTMWMPLRELARLIGKEPTMGNGLPVAAGLIALFGLLFLYGWWRNAALEYLPLRHLKPGQALKAARRVRRTNRNMLIKNALVNALLFLPALAGYLAVLISYAVGKIRVSSNPELMVTAAIRLFRSSLPTEQVLYLLAVLLILHVPLCVLRKMRLAVAVRRATREMNAWGDGHAAG